MQLRTVRGQATQSIVIHTVHSRAAGVGLTLEDGKQLLREICRAEN